jgi:hypothetical protein
MANIRTRINAVPTLIEPIFLLIILFIISDLLWFLRVLIYKIFSKYFQVMFYNIGVHEFLWHRLKLQMRKCRSERMQECLKEEERWKIEELSWLSGCHCCHESTTSQQRQRDNNENSLNPKL